MVVKKPTMCEKQSQPLFAAVTIPDLKKVPFTAEYTENFQVAGWLHLDLNLWLSAP